MRQVYSDTLSFTNSTLPFVWLLFSQSSSRFFISVQDSGVILTSVNVLSSNMSNTNGSSWFKLLVNVVFMTIFIIIIQNMDVLSPYSQDVTTTSTAVNDMRIFEESHT